jgi:(S)-2-hydroxy-acid oxidase
VETVYHVLEREFSRTMALASITRVQDIGKEYIGVKQIGGFGVSRL